MSNIGRILKRYIIIIFEEKLTFGNQIIREEDNIMGWVGIYVCASFQSLA
jgi:hypothetical protein